MSTKTSTTDPVVHNAPASTHRQSVNMHSADRPHRTYSSASRTASARPSSPHRSQSLNQPHPRPHSSSYQGGMAGVGRREHDSSNASAKPPSSGRGASHDRHSSNVTPSRSESVRSSNRHPPKTSGSNRHSDNPSAAAGVGGPVSSGDHGNKVTTGGNVVARRRTTLTTSSGQWALSKTIGAGSMGKVKLARNIETGEQVAVKIVPRQSTDEHRTAAERERADQSKEIRTAREAAIVTLVNHPYICGMRDFVRTNNHWYMLFEYVNGGQMLDYIISHGRLKEKQARKFGRQIASALDYCHRNSIVHRDLKIENILISKNGDIKIIDFGLSNLFSPRSHLRTFCGSLYFAAPELLQARQYVGPEVDIWSFGIVLYVLICGKVPFDDQSMPQLHAKIKKGVVEYPPWISVEGKNLLSRMLVTDPRQRATINDILSHPWITKGFNSAPENFLPQRDPIQLPLDPAVVEKMTGFDFGSAESITAKLTRVIESDDYQNAVRLAARKAQTPAPEADRRRGVFEFYKRRSSTASRDTLVTSSSEALQLGLDPINAYNPLVSVYYLVREKQEREKTDSQTKPLVAANRNGTETLYAAAAVPAPEAAYTNPATYEMAGERPTGGRSRPRARTHGEEEVTERLHNLNLNVPAGHGPPSIITPPVERAPAKKENTAAGLLRRFSTRMHRDGFRERAEPTSAPSVTSSGAADRPTSPRKSTAPRRARDKDAGSPSPLGPTGSGQLNQPDLLSPQRAVAGATRRLKGLGRSTSVNSADFRRRLSRRGASGGLSTEVRPPSGSDKSSLNNQRSGVGDAASDDQLTSTRSRAPSSRAKSLGHARRESIQARRAKSNLNRPNIGERTESGHEQQHEHELEQGQESEHLHHDGSGATGEPSPEMKPVFLKGLFSVSTTSSKPLSFIRSDIIRVLRELGVDYREIKGGFSCRHAPSIDFNKVAAALADKTPSSSAPTSSPLHRRRISFGALIGGDRERDEAKEAPPQKPARKTLVSRHRPAAHEPSDTNSDGSEESMVREKTRPRAAGETSTQVQNDLGKGMVLKFEIFVVKVPLLSFHGIQFKKVEGGTWQYKNMAQKILNELHL